MAAAHYQLDNLKAIVDCNRLQITGATRDVCNNEPLAEKFTSFGWNVVETDGHDLAALTAALTTPGPQPADLRDRPYHQGTRRELHGKRRALASWSPLGGGVCPGHGRA
jgi:hypothetical protein